MAWQTPKTDWKGRVVNGEYMGDRFNASDFNRIKNNLDELKNQCADLYKAFPYTSLGQDRTPADYFYADEINTLEENFAEMNRNTVDLNYGEPPIYTENGSTMNFSELNRLESAMLDLHKKLINQAGGRRMLTWNFGTGGAL